MENLPLEYKEMPLLQEDSYDIYFKVKEITPTQIKTLISMGAVCSLEKPGMPLVIETLNKAKFRIKDQLSAYVSVYTVFKYQGITVVSEDGERPVSYDDLLKYII